VRIVCDTNVLVSGVLFGGFARQLLVLVSRGKLTNFISQDLLREVEAVLSRPKFQLSPAQAFAIIGVFRETFEHVSSPAQPVRVVESDPDDDRVLEAAQVAGAEVIVTGDKHLLSLGTWQGIRIMSPAELIERLAEEDSKA
jgi:putative PIN family toxin of toxin-antitoxin system